jgi:hypothetical protein|tara:strand:+ start:186 stop:854 length:669 start_codon:yes stop_codon:yes gene_type:complete
MSKAIKVIAPIALAATGFGMAGMGPMAGFFAQTASIHTGIAGIAAGFGGFGTAMQLGGLAMQVAGSLNQRKYQSAQSGFMRQAQDQQNKANEVASRYRALQAKRQRVQTIRASRIESGQVEAAGAGSGLGSGGTSSIVGSVGGAGTQLSANLGNFGVSEGYGNQVSNLNQAAANSMSQANQVKSKSEMWSNVTTLGGDLFDNSAKIGNAFNNATKYGKTIFG